MSYKIIHKLLLNAAWWRLQLLLSREIPKKMQRMIMERIIIFYKNNKFQIKYLPFKVFWVF